MTKGWRWVLGVVAAVVAVVAASLGWLGDSIVGDSGALLLASNTFGFPFRAASRAAVELAATPPSGNAQEDIWHQVYDTQTFTTASTTRLVFFQAANSDKTLSNMEQGGSLPRPQSLRIHNIALDILTTTPVSTAAGGVAGTLDDLARLLLGVVGRPTWTLNISNKSYGPYSLTTLHGTGGPTGFGWGTFTAEESIQFAKNDPAGGWNYFGRVIIPEQINFNLEINYAATVAVTDAAVRFRVSLFGVLGRRVL